MRKATLVLITALIAVIVGVDPAFAAEEGAGIAKMGSIIGFAVAVFGGALSQGKIVSSAVESIGRNPGAAGQMFLAWLLGVVFIESLVILVFVALLIT